jgi:hypothetical protein
VRQVDVGGAYHEPSSVTIAGRKFLVDPAADCARLLLAGGFDPHHRLPPAVVIDGAAL